MHRASYAALGAVLVVNLLVVAAPRRASAASDRDSALLSFPLISVSTSLGVDTIVHISRSSDPIGPVALKCHWENATGACAPSGGACLSSSGCPPGETCVPSWSINDFIVQPTTAQPLAWRASQGLAVLPCSNPLDCGELASGVVPPVATDPFIGSLLCFAVDPGTLAPVDKNVFRGEATIETVAPGMLDVAKYNAVGLGAITGAVNTDESLVLGGAAPEYEGCPVATIVNHFYDGATHPVDGLRIVLTRLALLRCSHNLDGVDPGDSVAKLVTFNEFEQLMTVSTALRTHDSRRLSEISSVFLASIQGTLTGQTRILSQAGLFAAGIEEHLLIGPGGMRSAAFDIHGLGARENPDHIGAAPAICGDGIESAPEQCDDGNTADGDCCSSTCEAADDATPCDDGDECDTGDSCLSGVCVGGTPITCAPCQSCFAGIGCDGSCKATMNVSSGAALPGGRACVGLTLANTFPPAVRTRNTLELSDPTDITLLGCTLNPDLGGGAMQGKTLSVVEETRALTSLDVGGSPQDPIPDGGLYVCEYRLDAMAAGNRAVMNNATAYDQQGFAIVPSGGSGGEIIITDCPGNCNGNASVGIGELVRCVNHFLGRPLCDPRQPALSCPVAAGDNDGDVLVGEVMQCVNGFLRGC